MYYFFTYGHFNVYYSDFIHILMYITQKRINTLAILTKIVVFDIKVINELVGWVFFYGTRSKKEHTAPNRIKV